MSVTLDRPLPASLDAERSLLGSILLEGDRLVEVRGEISKEDFSLDAHRRVFASMCSLEDEGLAVDLVTVTQDLTDKKQAQAVGIAYLASFTENLPRRLSLGSYIAIVREKTHLRRLASLAQSALLRSCDESEDPTSIIAAIQDELTGILEDSQEGDNPLVSSYLVSVMNDLEASRQRPKEAGKSYGLASLDSFTGGMRDGEVTVVGARSGVGKSSLMCQAAVANCRAGSAVHLFSLEMTRAQVIHRIIAIISGVPFRHIDRPEFATDEQMMRIRRAGTEMAGWPLRIHDQSELHIDQIVGLARLSIRRHGSRFVAVDYAQNVRADGRDERTRVSDTSRKLTQMIKHEPASLMLLSQLRKVDREHYSKPPVIADLRETGQLENDAHVVLLLHRGWDEDAARIANEAEILVPKQRRGETGVIRARFSGSSVTFAEAS